MSNFETNPDITARIAIEALRNGVPNHEAVAKLGCNQPEAEERFEQMLDNVKDVRFHSGKTESMLISGGFGTGKSHLLNYFERIALSHNFVCSRVPISKETPLYDMGKVFISAMENGRVPGSSGRFIEELGLKINPGSDQYEALSHWADRAVQNELLSMIFPASLCAYAETYDRKLNTEIESFWAGQRLLMPNLRRGLREIGKNEYFRFRAPKVSELPPQRLQFAVKLIKSVGYRGWVILLDEIELIGSYSILQRARSYAEIANWLGQSPNCSVPGLVVVGAVTDDFASAVISPDGQKQDIVYVKPRLENSPRYMGLAPSAEKGMLALERQAIGLDSPDSGDIQSVMDALRSIYREAYDWEPPKLESKSGGAGFQARIRYKVRSAINEWDLRRLRPGYQPNIEISETTHSYEEDANLESASTENTP